MWFGIHHWGNGYASEKMELFPKKQVLDEYFRNKTTLHVHPRESKLTSLLVIVSPTQIQFG